MIGNYAAKLALVIVLLGVIGMYEFIQSKGDNRAFEDHALTTHAQPAGPVATGQSYQGDLIFSTKTGETVTIPATQVPLAIRDSFRFASNTQIKYFPENPSKVRFSDSVSPGPNSLAVPVLFLGVGLVAFRLLRRSRQ